MNSCYDISVMINALLNDQPTGANASRFSSAGVEARVVVEKQESETVMTDTMNTPQARNAIYAANPYAQVKGASGTLFKVCRYAVSHESGWKHQGWRVLVVGSDAQVGGIFKLYKEAKQFAKAR